MPSIDTDQFAHIRRMRDPRFPHEIASILPGEYFVSSDSMIVYTILGSCVSACIRDPIAKVGGMNHFMLPAPKGENGHDSWGESTRYGSYAMELLINEILKRGGNKSRLEVKIFGGGKLFESKIDVGQKNVEWAIEFLRCEGLPIVKADVGDMYPRKVYYFTETGKVLMKKVERASAKTVVEQEVAYEQTLVKQAPAGEVTLF